MTCLHPCLLVLLLVMGVDPDKKVRGTDWWVTQPFPAGGLGGAGAPEANVFWNKCFENELKIRSLFGHRLYPEFRSNKRRSLAVTTQDRQCCPWLCKNLLISGWRPDVHHRELSSSSSHGGATSSALANLDH